MEGKRERRARYSHCMSLPLWVLTVHVETARICYPGKCGGNLSRERCSQELRYALTRYRRLWVALVAETAKGWRDGCILSVPHLFLATSVSRIQEGSTQLSRTSRLGTAGQPDVQADFSPRLVVLEYGENLPFMEDVLVRYTTLPSLSWIRLTVLSECVRWLTDV